MADEKGLEKFKEGTVVYVRDECENLFLEQDIIECVIKESMKFVDEPNKILIQLYPIGHENMEFALCSDEENEKFFFDKEDAKIYQLVSVNEE